MCINCIYSIYTVAGRCSKQSGVDHLDIVISTSVARPIYEQIKEQIESAIICGEMGAGDRLPSIRMLANELGVSVITTKRAYAALEAAGFIESVQGRGCFVSTQDANVVKDERARRVKNSLRSAIEDGRRAGMSNAELSRVFKDCLENEHSESAPPAERSAQSG